MTKFTSIMVGHICKNVTFITNDTNSDIDIEIIGTDTYDDCEPVDIGRFFLISISSEKYNTSITEVNTNLKRAITSIRVCDRWTTRWLTNNSNSLFEEFESIGICRFFHHVNYRKSRIENIALEKMEISLFSGMEIDQSKEDCLYSHIQWYNSFCGDIEKKVFIIDSLYDKIRLGLLDSNESVDALRSILIGAKLANDPNQLGNY